MLIVDLGSPGIEIRPIRQINEGAEFCEVFLTDVRVPATNLIREADNGWTVTRGLLAIEHEYVGRSNDGGQPEQGGIEDLVALAKRLGRDRDPSVRRRIAEMHVLLTMQSLSASRLSNAMAAGELDHAYGGVLKLNSAEILQRRSELGLAIAGASGAAWRRGDEDAKSWSLSFLGARASSIAGGTNEIQRNNIGERALGLPREPSADRDVPFDQIPRN
jgi:alkylation response protein AidB-like acyl-CoA dehydrogenase